MRVSDRFEVRVRISSKIRVYFLGVRETLG